ncbi:hypothetical protein SAMN05216337_1042100, partial [Bradyrhizobium brasilense]
PRPTRIVTPSASISMPPASQRRAPTSGLALRRAILRSWPTVTAGTMASTTAGTNGGSSAIGVGNRRACRRQVNTCCGVSRCRRAISETTAPGTSVSSTIRALSSLENQRRRPVSVITSSRRAVTSDLSVWSSIDTSRSLQRDRETRLSRVPREGGSRTTLTNLVSSLHQEVRRTHPGLYGPERMLGRLTA